VIFADTFYFLALLNPRYASHNLALEASRRLSGKLFTTHYVLIEVADAFAGPPDRLRFLTLLDDLESSTEVIIVPASDDLLRRGIRLYRERSDKDWPLTDCISFVVMTDNSITDALTGDVHFQQAGFRPMLVRR